MIVEGKCITDIEGVYASGMHCGIKPEKPDLAYIYVPDAVASVGVFTQNRFKAPSVVYTAKILKKGLLKAMIINSGNANCGTGKPGAAINKSMSVTAAQCLGLKPSQVGVASTGKIADPLDSTPVLKGIESLLNQPLKQEGSKAAEAILTTDLTVKEIYVEKKIGKKNIAVAGMTKGSGMIAPNMATTLSFLATNIKLPSPTLQTMFKKAIDASFNVLSVDTDTSTNDMAMLFATGQYQITPHELNEFQDLLTLCCIELAKRIAQDGEGATKMIEVNVSGAVNIRDARIVALNVVNSPLVKTAVHGADPNWGRIVAAACKDPKVKINPDKLTVVIADIPVFSKGKPTDVERAILVKALSENTVKIDLDLELGKAKGSAWGCDLTKGYIDINVEYN